MTKPVSTRRSRDGRCADRAPHRSVGHFSPSPVFCYIRGRRGGRRHDQRDEPPGRRADMNRLSLAPLTSSEAAPLDLIDAAAAGGFDAVALGVVDPPGVTGRAPPGIDVAAIRKRLSETGIRVFATTGIWLTPD